MFCLFEELQQACDAKLKGVAFDQICASKTSFQGMMTSVTEMSDRVVEQAAWCSVYVVFALISIIGTGVLAHCKQVASDEEKALNFKAD